MDLGIENEEEEEEEKEKSRLKLNLDLNLAPPGDELGFPFQDSSFLEKQTENDRARSRSRSAHDAEASSSSQGERARFDDSTANLDLELNLGLGAFNRTLQFQAPISDLNVNLEDCVNLEEVPRQTEEGRGKKRFRVSEYVVREFARAVAANKGRGVKEVSENLGDDHELGLFSLAVERIKKRNASVGLFEWRPRPREGKKPRCNAPKLVDVSLRALAKHADAIASLELIPDFLRHRLSQEVGDRRKMDARFVELLARGSPTEIRVKDASQLTEEDLGKIFEDCNTRCLTVLQLDLCGQCMTDHVLHNNLARSSNRFPALVAISLRGAYRLSDSGLTVLAKSAPALQSVNLSQCSFVTSDGIKFLAGCFESTLKELYIDDCQSIDAMIILPALKRLKRLEVLSVAGIQTVSDDFVIQIVGVCGINMKELVFANCLKLTDLSIKVVGKTCPRLCAIDLSYLHNLTDSTVEYLANGCQSIQSLKLCRNGFSDEAIAAFLEVAGQTLNVLSLNNISRVALNTAASIAKSGRNLLILDLSWCRKLTDEAVGLIVDSCPSLKQLKLFGCTQITDVLLDGVSNPQVKIIGCTSTPVLEDLSLLELPITPLRYSPLTAFANLRSLDMPDT